MHFKSLFNLYYIKIIFWILLTTTFIFSANYGIDKKIIVFIAFVISVFTEVFVGLSALVATIPIVGPMIIKIVTGSHILIVDIMVLFISMMMINMVHVSMKNWWKNQMYLNIINHGEQKKIS